MKLLDLLEKETRVVAGLMSGTSLDGVDICVARISGSGSTCEMEILAFDSKPYSDELREVLLSQSQVEKSDVATISQLNVRLAREYSDVIRSIRDDIGIEIDLIGSHGQTIHHLPNGQQLAGSQTRSTFQLGDHSTLANLIDIPVVGNFRMADMAVGGQGAPLVNYLDHVLFSSDEAGRLVLNVGGISNLTIMQKGAGVHEIIAFDTGPGNMPIDLLMEHHFGKRFDEDGMIAESGVEIESFVEQCLDDGYVSSKPPKSTGRKDYGDNFIRRLLAEQDFATRSPQDQIRSVTEFVARSIAHNVTKFVGELDSFDQLLVAGGGVHNNYLMRRMKELLPSLEVVSSAKLGLNPDARESLCFALFAHEFLNGQATNCMSATGANRPVIQGSLAIP